MDFPILIIWMGPFSILGESGVKFHFSMKIKIANRIAPDWTPRFAAYHMGLLCLPMSHKKDAKLIWVKCPIHCDVLSKFLLSYLTAFTCQARWAMFAYYYPVNCWLCVR